MKQLILISVLTLSGLYSQAQNILDLERYSNTQLMGGARFEGMGGSFGALGADLSSALINPAGFGRYSSSAFNFSAQVQRANLSSTFNNETTDQNTSSFKPSSAGVVITTDISKNNNGFQYFQLGFTYNRMQNFNQTIRYEGEQFYSLLDEYCYYGTGILPADLNSFLPFSTSMAWETYAIDQDGNGGYVPRLTNGNNRHQRTVTQTGGIQEYTISLSGNYLNKLYIGANWGIRNIRYDERVNHKETLLENEGVSLNSFEVTNFLKTRGNGHNLKAGVIYLPVDNIRIGLAYHSPTIYSLTENFGADMIAYHKDGPLTLNGNPPTGDFKYRLVTPAKWVASGAYVFGTRGAINVDVERINYTRANLKASNDYAFSNVDYSAQNRDADTSFRSVFNLRIGGELVFQSKYFVRGGFGLYPHAFRNDLAADSRGVTTYSVGGGIKFKRSTFDVAYRLTNRSFQYYAYFGSETNVSQNNSLITMTYSILF